METRKTGETAFAPAEFVIRFAQDANDLRAIRNLREQVFGVEQGIPDSGEEDPDDWRSFHIMVLSSDEVIGAGRLTLPTTDQPYAIITWVATLAPYRRQGIGTAIMRSLIDTAMSAHVSTILLSAQTHALAFYQDLGFVPYGKRFVASGIEHQSMYLSLHNPISY